MTNNINTNNNQQQLSFDQLFKLHKSKVMKKSKHKFVLYERYYKLFSSLQTPKNKSEIHMDTRFTFDMISNQMLPHLIKLNIIKKIDYNPNKYMLTEKGKYVLYKIIQLNQELEKNTRKLTKHEFITDTSPNRERTKWKIVVGSNN